MSETSARDPESDLREAAAQGDMGAIRAAMAAGAKDLNRALARAAGGGHVLAASYLLDQGASIRRIGPPLMAAAQAGSADVLRLLFERGAVLLDDDLVQEALEAAVEAGNVEAVELLLDHGADMEPNLYEPFFIAAGNESWEIVQLLSKRGIRWYGKRDRYGHRPSIRFGAAIDHLLPWIAEKGNTDSIRVLLECGAHPCERSIRVAEENGHGEIAALLRKAAGISSY